MQDIEEVLENLKEINWHESVLNFYVVKRTLRNKKAKYNIKQLNLESDLHFKIKGITSNKIYHMKNVAELDAKSLDSENSTLFIQNSETDLAEIITTLNSKTKPELITSSQELLGSWFYIAKLEAEGQELFAVRKVSTSWNTKNVRQFANTIFTDNKLVDLDEKEVFKLDGDIDFISYNKHIFISNKSNFKSVLNHRD